MARTMTAADKKAKRERLDGLRPVTRVDRSPMNPKIWCAQLACGHDVFVSPPARKPRIGSKLICVMCRNR